MARPIPEGFHTITPYLTVKGAAALLEFLQRALRAEVVHCTAPGGVVRHAQVRIGDSMLMLGDCPDGFEPTRSMLYLYVNDVDAWYRHAVQNGAESVEEPADMFYGDRHGAVRDPAGNLWYIATHKEDVPEEEIERRMREMKDHG